MIAFLTILGFSIYDGIVVFDRVDENTKLLRRAAKMTYCEMANLSLNQVLMRSLNTSITALLPVLSVLVVGAYVLGADTLGSSAWPCSSACCRAPTRRSSSPHRCWRC